MANKCKGCGPSDGDGFDEVSKYSSEEILIAKSAAYSGYVKPGLVGSAVCPSKVIVISGAPVSNCRTCGNTYGSCGCSNTLYQQTSGCCPANQPVVSHTSTCSTNSPCGSSCSCSKCVPSCVQDHARCIIQKSVGVAVKITNAWNVPECGETATLNVPGLTEVGIGSILWIQSFGYFTITQFNYNSGNPQLTIRNDCLSANADPGTSVPACTVGTIGIPDSSGTSTGGPSSIYPYQASDFVIPAVSAGDGCTTPVQISVTNVNGLSAGKNVQIAGNTYLLVSVDSATLITICNKGLGGTVGTTVFARDSSDLLIHPIILIDQNSCTNEPITSGAVLACNEGTASPITGAMVGMLLSLTNIETGEAQYVASPFPTLNCTSLTECLTLDPELPADHAYLVYVLSTADFLAGDLVLLGGRAGTVDSIIDATSMRVIFTDAIVTAVTYPVGTPLCEADCCTTIQNEIDGFAGYNQGYANSSTNWFNVDTGVADNTLTNVAEAVQTAWRSYTFVNPSSDLPMDLIIVVTTVADLTVDSAAASAGADCTTENSIEYQVDPPSGPPPPTPQISALYFTYATYEMSGSTDLIPCSVERTLTISPTVAAGATLTLMICQKFVKTSGSTSMIGVLGDESIDVRAIGVAL